MVIAKRIDATDTVLIDPVSPEWDQTPPSDLTLEPTPITAQPSQYIQEKWKVTAYGVIENVTVRAAHNGERLYFRLSWADETGDEAINDTDQFTDAAAVLFPVNGDAPLQSMGSPKEPVTAWYWRPDLEEPLSVSAQGIGTSGRIQDPELGAFGVYEQGSWSVVLRRKLTSQASEDVNLTPGSSGKVGFAVWQGSHQERGGLKAVTLEWEPLEIEE
jgi:DMSO reductase family type II enzyme heme b subunit